MQTELLYAWAVTYRQAGWCVLPAKNKHPLIDWKQYQRNLPSIEQVQEWFSGASEDGQIALVTGKVSEVSVIDIDKHKEGCPAKRGHVCNCNPISVDILRARFPFTLTAKSGTGGYHLFFEYEPRLSNSVGLADPQIDVRSDGGIIILSPSLHDRVKLPYSWDDLAPWNFENLHNLAKLPEEFLTGLRMKPKADWVKIIQEGNGQGRRNVNTTALIGKLLRVFKPEEYQVVWELIWLWNKGKNIPPLSDYELTKTFESIVKKHLSERGVYGK